MSTPFNVQKWARQAGIQMTGGFCVVAECVTVDELKRFANNVIDGMALAQTQEQKPQIAFNAEVVGYVAPQRPWVGLNKEEANALQLKYQGKPISLSAAVENLLREKNHG